MRAFLMSIFLLTAICPLHASDVKLKKTGTSWKLLVDGKPFFIKGVGCNTATGPENENYLAMARDMGANSVRTWGITPKEYFDQAGKYGLMVNAGVWFNPVRGGADSYQSKEYCDRMKAETLAHVREMKEHPALLMWNLGNEVFAFTENEEEKVAFGRFLQDLIVAVKKEDPHHPVVYACAGAADFPYLKKHVPALDIVGINTYSGFGLLAKKKSAGGDARPVLASEFGPLGAWDLEKDATGLAFDPYDHLKARSYANLWREVSEAPGSVGGYAFVLGDSRNQDSLTWWNLNHGKEKKEGYWTLYSAFTGKEPKNDCPRIKLFKMNGNGRVYPGQSIELDTTATDPNGDKLSYSYLLTDIASDPLVVQPARFYPVQPEALTRNKSRVKIRVPNDPGIYRVYVLVRDGKGNVATANRGILVISKGT